MYNLIILNEKFTNGYNNNILNILYLIIIISGILVITSKNPIISVLFLIGLFSTIASYLILIGLSFIGLSYLIVYIGAVSILFLFILRLINIRISELKNNSNNSIPLIIILLILFYNSLFKILPYNITIWNKNGNLFSSINDNFQDTMFIMSKSWDGNLIDLDHISSIGNLLYTNYNIWLIITSYILLLAMVGTIVITIKQPT